MNPNKSFPFLALIVLYFLCFLLILSYDLLLVETFQYENLDLKHDHPPKIIKFLLSRNNAAESLRHHSSFSDFNCFSHKSFNIPSALHDFKINLKNTTDIVTHKFKVFDRTFSWFFKGSRPGGGRGL